MTEQVTEQGMCGFCQNMSKKDSKYCKKHTFFDNFYFSRTEMVLYAVCKKCVTPKVIRNFKSKKKVQIIAQKDIQIAEKLVKDHACDEERIPMEKFLQHFEKIKREDVLWYSNKQLATTNGESMSDACGIMMSSEVLKKTRGR